MRSTTAYQKSAQLLLNAYPRTWRERYAEEAGAILEERPATLRTLFDLFLGMLDAHIHSDLFTERKYMLMQRVYKNQLTLFCLAILSIFPWLGIQITQIPSLSLFGSVASANTRLNYYNSVNVLTKGINLAGMCLFLAILLGSIALVHTALKETRSAHPGLRKLFISWCVSAMVLLTITLLFLLQQRSGLPLLAIVLGPLYSIVPVPGLLLLLWVVIVGPLCMLLQARNIAVSSQLTRSTLIPALIVTLTMSMMAILMLLTAIELAASLPDLGGLKRVIFFNFDVACMLLLTILAFVTFWRSWQARRRLALS